MMGAIVSSEHAWEAVQRASVGFGQTVGADDAYLVLRGMRSLIPRMEMHAGHAMKVAGWLRAQPAVARVLSPALPGDPGYALWRRDCHGTNGLLAVEFVPSISAEAMEAAINRLQLFGIGASWGGFESLALPVDMAKARTVADWSGRGAMMRLHVGLEDPDDLVADLRQALSAISP
jgi:cystathionine beta-lyase